MKLENNKRYNIHYISIIFLSIGIVLIPTTSWRIWKIGPSELILFMWSLIYLLTNRKLLVSKKYILFWFSFITLIFIGTLIGLVLVEEGTEIQQIFTWVYFMFISMVLFSFGRSSEELVFLKAIELIIKISFFVYSFIYLTTFKNKNSFLGALVWYGNSRFTGGASNPHQFSIYALILFFLSLFLFSIENKKFYLIISLVFLFLGIKTDSSTFFLSVFCGVFTLIFSKRFQNIKNKEFKLMVVLLLIGMLITIFHSEIIRVIGDFIDSDVNGRDRLMIFSTYFEIWDKSFLFGIGPGTHARNSTIEFHNAYIEIIVMSGFLSLILFLALFKNVYRSFKGNPYFIAILFSTLIYGFAGFVFRRLIFWVFLSILYSFSTKINY